MTVLSTMTDDELLVKWANRREEEARALLHRPSGVNASAYLDELRRRLAENTRLRGEVEALTRANAEDRAGRYAENTRLREERNEGNSRGLIAEREVARLRGLLTGWEVRCSPAETFQARYYSVERGSGRTLEVIARHLNLVQAEAIEAWLAAALSEGGTDASSSAGSET